MTPTQLAAMLQLQYKMNAKVNPDWVNAGNDWCRAIVVEGGEAIEHHGWKWWKQQVRDDKQLFVELVDIWHFALSQAIVQACGDQVAAADAIFNNLNADYQRGGITFDGAYKDFKSMNMLERLELMIGLAVSNRFSYPLFETFLTDLDADWDQLHRVYVAKNVLNFFRQDHGYKDGTYRKVWLGLEDNEHLIEIADSLDPKSDMFEHNLYDALADRYRLTTA